MPKFSYTNRRFYLLGLSISFSLVVLAASFAVFKFEYSRTIEGDLKAYQDESVSLLKFDKARETERMNDVFGDLKMISQLPAMQAFLEKTTEGNKTNLKELFLAVANSHSVYDQISYIDSTGQEVVRVNYNVGKPAVVPEKDLQNKKGRYYFEDAFKLEKGQIYISPMDLNVEGKEVEYPFKPMLRIATPVFVGSEKKGILILNYLAQEILDDLDALKGENHKRSTFLLNDQGYWLNSDKAEEEWGFMFSDKSSLTLANRNPGLWKMMLEKDSGQMVLQDGIYTFDTISPTTNQSVTWKIYRFLSREVIYGESDIFYSRFVKILVIASVVFILLNIVWFLIFRYFDRQIAEVFKTQTDLINKNTSLMAEMKKNILQKQKDEVVLKEKMGQVEKMNDLLVNRELKMMELKKENERLKKT